MQRLTLSLPAIVLGVHLTAAPLMSQAETLTGEQAASVNRLIASLGDDEFRVRESATASLIKFDDAAVEPLIDALKTTNDPEVAFRLRRILASISRDLPGSPAEVVTSFLTAVKDGNHDIIAQCLTQKARVELESAGIHPAPPGNANATFKIGEVRLVDEKRAAHVDCQWTDEERSYEITWIVRREADGWAVAGMSTRLFDDAAPLVLNFEDPADIKQQVQAAQAELAKGLRGP